MSEEPQSRIDAGGGTLGGIQSNRRREGNDLGSSPGDPVRTEREDIHFLLNQIREWMESDQGPLATQSECGYLGDLDWDDALPLIQAGKEVWTGPQGGDRQSITIYQSLVKLVGGTGTEDQSS